MTSAGPLACGRGLISSVAVGFLTVAIRAYQLVVSPAQLFLFGAAGGCRYTPSCSVYAVEALRAHGAATGTALAARRICRCHPWGGGGHDPVPTAKRPQSEPRNPKSEIRH